MFEFIRLQPKHKAALGLAVTLFVAAACSHNGMKQEDGSTPEEVTQSAEPTPAPVGLEPQTPYDSMTPAPIQQAATKKVKKSKKGSKKKGKKGTKKAKMLRKSKKRKFVKNFEVKESKQDPMIAAGTMMDVPPPPPMPPAPPVFPEVTKSALVEASASGSSSKWIYVITAVAAGMIVIGFRLRQTRSKKSRRLIFN